MEEGKEKRICKLLYRFILDVMRREILRNPESFWLRYWFLAIVKFNGFVVFPNNPSISGRPIPIEGWLVKERVTPVTLVCDKNVNIILKD